MESLSDRRDEERKAEMTLLLKLEELTSQGAKRDFCHELNVPWDEYLHLKRKYRFVMERFRKEKEDD